MTYLATSVMNEVIGGAVMSEPRLCNGQCGHDALSEHLPELDAPPIEYLDCARSTLA
jgi:hypothetical protein